MGATQEQSAAPALVLIVDDDRTVQKVVGRVLKHLGFRTESAADGAEALAAHASRAFDAILMDCQMPVMDGFQATKAIRSAETATGTHTPIIALTAMQAARKRCLDVGMDDYLEKPVSPDNLAAAIRRAISRARSQGPTSEHHSP
jgi:CheY-like chemotaxis protein